MSGGDDSSGSDAEFRRYQRSKWKEDLQSVQPINGTRHRGRAVLDRYSRRDLNRWVGGRHCLMVDIPCST
jgi:hypothetical protein